MDIDLGPAGVAEILDVPASWRMVGYLWVGYPASEDDVPEFEREGWERRRAVEPLRRRLG